MIENRIVESGTFGPVFAGGLDVDGGPVKVTEGIVQILLRRHDAFLMIEMTVGAATALTQALGAAVDLQLTVNTGG